MSDLIQVTPVEGRRVRDHIGALPISETGKMVENSIYWLRLQMRGDVTIERVDSSKSAKKVAKAAKSGAAGEES